MSTRWNGGRRRYATVDVVIPVYNEEVDLESSVRRLRSYLDSAFPFETTVTIADNASTDDTDRIARRLAAELPGVRAIHLGKKGRGRALKTAWMQSDADIVAYMDVDLSTDLDALLPLVAPLASGHSDIAIGSRLAGGSQVVRGPKREVISRIYNLVLRAALHNRFSDAQCGFKALRSEDARALLPAVVDNEWFFDTELLMLAEHNGLRIHEVPVDWTDDPDSRVHIARTAMADLRGVCRLTWAFASGKGRLDNLARRRGRPGVAELVRFARVGAVSTVASIALFVLFRRALSPYPANLAALLATSLANTLVHLRYTFAQRTPKSTRATVIGAGMTISTSVVLTTWCLAAAAALRPGSLPVEIVALLIGSAAAALVRFVLFRAVVYREYVTSRTPSGASNAQSRGPGSGIDPQWRSSDLVQEEPLGHRP